jgi:hypothetical protein
MPSGSISEVSTGTRNGPRSPAILTSVHHHRTTMFSPTLTNSRSFGATYQRAILSVLPMDDDRKRHGLNSPEIKEALGLSNAARTSLCLMMKEMAAAGLVQRYDLKIGNRRIVSYKRLLPLRKRERIARFLMGV